MVRVISGVAKGRRLEVPRGESVRPTLDRVKESIFNIIAGKIEGSEVLDLYAGSGSLGLEALSRGARFVSFVEKNRAAIEVIRKNLGRLGFQNTQILAMRVEQFLKRKLQGGPFDLVFVDPPYEYFAKPDYAAFLIEAIARFLDPEGIMVLEHPSRIRIEVPHILTLSKERKFGQTHISFFRKLSVG